MAIAHNFRCCFHRLWSSDAVAIHDGTDVRVVENLDLKLVAARGGRFPRELV